MPDKLKKTKYLYYKLEKDKYERSNKRAPLSELRCNNGGK